VRKNSSRVLSVTFLLKKIINNRKKNQRAIIYQDPILSNLENQVSLTFHNAVRKKKLLNKLKFYRKIKIKNSKKNNGTILS